MDILYQTEKNHKTYCQNDIDTETAVEFWAIINQEILFRPQRDIERLLKSGLKRVKRVKEAFCNFSFLSDVLPICNKINDAVH